MKKAIVLLFANWLVFISSVSGQTIKFIQTGEEFCGPFSSWKNIKTDFGAMGDGVTNDAPAINAALVAMKKTQLNSYNVLYFPAGTYLIDTTLYNPGRTLGDDYSGLAIIGEDPATTTILWNGPAAGTMFQLDGWYLRVSRLTFNGQNNAAQGIYRNGGFSTGNEISDVIFTNFLGTTGGGFALNFGAATNGQAENAVLRCQFLNCKYGILSCNWNSLDQWIWNCLFQNCKYGIDLCVGYYQIYENVFINSGVYDIGGGNTYQSAVVNNTSINSPCFFQKGPGYLRGNKIYTEKDSFQLVGAVLLDNVVRAPNTIYPIQRISGLNITGKQNMLIGNTYSTSKRAYPFSWAVQPSYNQWDHGSGGSGNFGKPIEKSIDNNPATSFVCQPTSATGSSFGLGGIKWNCPAGTYSVVVKYTLTGPTDTVNLRNFKLMGSNDWGMHWTVLDSQVNQHFVAGVQKVYPISNLTAYSMYQLVQSNVTAWIEIREFELIDGSGNDITSDSKGLLSGADEFWGGYYAVDNNTLDSASITVPDTIYMPGIPKNMHRNIYEVLQGTGNDAAAIQQKVDSAALLPLGTKSIVHIRKGTYTINTTIQVPAGSDMQIVGDGVGSGTISTLNWNGNNTGPLMKCLGPSRVTIKDIMLNVPYHQNAGMDALRIEDADQVGGRIYANQFFAGSSDATHSSDVAIYADGIENSDVTITCSSYGAALNGVVRATGGPVLSSNGNTNGQISCLSGAFGGTQNLFAVDNGGRITAEGMWYEGYNTNNTSGLLNLNNASGKLSIACMQWYLNNCTSPIIATNNFQGTMTLLDNGFNQVPRTQVQMSGSGANGNFLAGYNYFGGADTIGITADSIWQDVTAPGSNNNFLSNVAGKGAHYRQLDNVVNKIHFLTPDTNSVLNALAQIRAARTDPPFDKTPGVTDVKLFRVASRTVEGNIAAHFISSASAAGIGNSANAKAGNSILVYPNPNTGVMHIQLNGESVKEKNQINVYNIFGELVFTQTSKEKIIPLDLSTQPAGLYVIQVNGQSVRVVKE